MKALSVQQPWADLIIRGKDVENRTWSTNYRGPLLIHAGATLRNGPIIKKAYGPDHEWELGGIVGIVDLVDCVKGHESPWAQPNAWHWVVKNPRRVPFVPMKGTLGLFEVTWPSDIPPRLHRRDERPFGAVAELFARLAAPIDELARVLPLPSLHAMVAALGNPPLPNDEGARAAFAERYRRRLNTVLNVLSDTDRRALLAAAGLSARSHMQAWVNSLGGLREEDIADDPEDLGAEAEGGEGNPATHDDDDFIVEMDKAEVVKQLRIKLEDDYLYYFDVDSVMRVPGGDLDAEPELVMEAGVQREPGFRYFIDERGDLLRCPQTRRHGLPIDAPLVVDVLEWVGFDGGRAALAALCDVRKVPRRRSIAETAEELSRSYRGDLAALIQDLRPEDLVSTLGDGIEIKNGWWSLPDAETMSLDELRAVAKRALCELDTSGLVLEDEDEDEDENQEGEEEAQEPDGNEDDEDDDLIARLRERLAQYSGRRAFEVRSLLKKAELGDFARLRTDRFQELRGLVDAAGYVLCDAEGTPFTFESASPGIEARVRLTPKTATTGAALTPTTPNAAPAPADPSAAVPPTPAPAGAARTAPEASDEPEEQDADSDADDDVIVRLRERLAQYGGRRAVEVRSLLKKAELGDFVRLRTDRFQELRRLIDAAGFVLCDAEGTPFAADSASPGIDARVRLTPKTAGTDAATGAAPPPNTASAAPSPADPSAASAPTPVPPAAESTGAPPTPTPQAAAGSGVSDYETAVARLRLLTSVPWPERRTSPIWPSEFISIACERPLEDTQRRMLSLLSTKLADGGHEVDAALSVVQATHDRGRLAALVDAFELLNDGASDVGERARTLRQRLKLA